MFTPLVYGWARRGGLNDSDAADVVQEVSQAVASHVHDFQRDHSQGSFRGWVRSITRNCIRQHYRRRATRLQAAGGETLQELAQLPEPPSADGEPDDPSDRRALVHRALQHVIVSRNAHASI